MKTDKQLENIAREATQRIVRMLDPKDCLDCKSCALRHISYLGEGYDCKKGIRLAILDALKRTVP